MVALNRTDRSLKPWVWLVPIIALLVLFPPVRFRSIELPEVAGGGAGISPQTFALTFWQQTLPKHEAASVELTALWDAIAEDSTDALKAYSRRAGVGARAVFLVRGAAKVSRIDERGIWLDLARKTTGDTVLLSGPIFGNQVRDATGLINVSDFSSFDFNAISEELNRLVESRVQPNLRKVAAVGAQLEIFGAAELDDASRERQTLKIVPLRITLK